jgi:dsDNA-specific endonuclease/ATPase MutS2
MMADSPETARGKSAPSNKRPGASKRKSASGQRGQDVKARQSAERDASKIVAQAYEEAARIIDEAKLKAEHTVAEANKRDKGAYRQLGELLKSRDMNVAAYEQIDDLFVRIRRQLGELTENDQAAAGELKDLVNQLEYWVETLVIDSVKLKSVRHWLQGTTELAKKLRAQLDVE